MSIAVTLGSVAGYYRGWADTPISRVRGITMAYPHQGTGAEGEGLRDAFDPRALR